MGPPVRSTKALGGAVRTNIAAPQAVVDGDRQRKPPQPRREIGSSPAPTTTRPAFDRSRPMAGGKKIVVILAKAGLRVGHDGLVDAYGRGGTTRIAAEHLAPYRPDIVHQCLLALFDSDMAAAGRLQVIIVTERGKTIEVNPTLRPPRTYGRFKGLMEKLLQEGVVKSADGQWLLRTTRWSVAPQIPHGAEVYGIHNAESSSVVSAVELARGAVAEPVPTILQGGIKDAYGFYCVSCTDDSNLDGLDFVTQSICLSKYPTAPHVACLRLAEGFRFATSAVTTDIGSAKEAAGNLTAALQPAELGKKRQRF
jgi:rRNA small subunit pseudouridine methyltransferase Nep1